ncbi:hypothetical protein [Streptomyces sp. VRA16 Mangrove soil]|uniref:hypothetical protein n=1 Tax=Streptomyces sp. VRA16 Mangrove soil TaxID=2817434 RepID=UPI001A9D8899|nr:hypothetical protein [Streptomyces sp. VRA16 Mangrove soil]MBO1336542.1 hypothetical protein [Streptomyces sp. VRA16 Mangrove soil]
MASAVSVPRRVASAALVLLLSVAGCWASWGTAQHVVFPKGREHGQLTITRCTGSTCAGSFVPAAEGPVRRPRVTISRSVGEKKGARLSVVLKPDSAQAVRTGAAGFFKAWIPLGGALLLACVVLAGGMRDRRLAWVTGGAGFVLLTAAWFTAAVL